MGNRLVALTKSHGTGRVKASGRKQSPARGISHIPPVQAIPCLVHRSLRGVKRGWSIDWSKALGGSEAEGFSGKRDAGSGSQKRGGVEYSRCSAGNPPTPTLAQPPLWGQSVLGMGTWETPLEALGACQAPAACRLGTSLPQTSLWTASRCSR